MAFTAITHLMKCFLRVITNLQSVKDSRIQIEALMRDSRFFPKLIVFVSVRQWRRSWTCLAADMASTYNKNIFKNLKDILLECQVINIISVVAYN